MHAILMSDSMVFTVGHALRPHTHSWPSGKVVNKYMHTAVALVSVH